MSVVASFRANAALIDIEGTISPIAFVRETLFGYSRGRIAEYLTDHARDSEVAAIIQETRRLTRSDDAVAALENWQARDAKVPPLKALQGLIWESGYAAGAFESSIFVDALDALRRWLSNGVRLSVYSSGSKKAQDLFFRYNEAGDLRSLFSAFFDTGIGPKTDHLSYVEIARMLGEKPNAIVFFSDNSAELLAAEAAGLQVAHVVKETSTVEPRWPAIADFSEVTIAPEAPPP